MKRKENLISTTERRYFFDITVILIALGAIAVISIFTDIIDIYNYAVLTLSKFELGVLISGQMLLAIYLIFKLDPNWDKFYYICRIFFRKNIVRWHRFLKRDSIQYVPANIQRELAKNTRFKSCKTMSIFYLIACEILGENTTFCRVFNQVHMTPINYAVPDDIDVAIEMIESSIRRHEKSANSNKEDLAS